MANNKNKTGFIFGKFDPFHKGHEMFIRKALDMCDNLIMLVYDHREKDLITTHDRVQLIEKILSSEKLKIIEAYDSPPPGKAKDIRKAHNEYISKLLPEGIKIDNVFSNEWYGEDVANFLDAERVKIDPERKEVPISGTEVRKDPGQCREYLPQEVVEYIFGSSGDPNKTPKEGEGVNGTGL